MGAGRSHLEAQQAGLVPRRALEDGVAHTHVIRPDVPRLGFWRHASGLEAWSLDCDRAHNGRRVINPACQLSVM